MTDEEMVRACEEAVRIFQELLDQTVTAIRPFLDWAIRVGLIAENDDRQIDSSE